MRPYFTPKLDVLPPEQRRLWPLLSDVPKWFTLCGGTAIALHLGHRESLDFDFFGDRAFNPGDMLNRVAVLHGAEVVQQEPNTVTCLAGDRAMPVRVSFFGVPKLRLSERVLLAEDNGVRVASLRDLAGMKAAVVQRRAEVKDYLDMDALMQAGVSLPQALSSAAAIYGSQFNPDITLKALSYFGEPELAALPAAVKRRLQRAVRAASRP
jgi:hypothetical protein